MDNVPYADLPDFLPTFWLKRAVGDLYPELFSRRYSQSRWALLSFHY